MSTGKEKEETDENGEKSKIAKKARLLKKQVKYAVLYNWHSPNLSTPLYR